MKTRLTSLILLFALCCPAITSGEPTDKKKKQEMLLLSLPDIPYIPAKFSNEFPSTTVFCFSVVRAFAVRIFLRAVLSVFQSVKQNKSNTRTSTVEY